MITAAVAYDQVIPPCHLGLRNPEKPEEAYDGSYKTQPIDAQIISRNISLAPSNPSKCDGNTTSDHNRWSIEDHAFTTRQPDPCTNRNRH